MAGRNGALRRSFILLACGGMAALAFPSFARAESLAGEDPVIPVAGAGAATGSAWFPLENAFDDQPTLSPPTQERYLGTDGVCGRPISARSASAPSTSSITHRR